MNFFFRLINDEDRLRFFELVKSCSQSAFKVDLAKILFPHVLGGSSVVEDEHLRTLCFGDYMHPEADKRTYDEIPDLSLLTKGWHFLPTVRTSGSSICYHMCFVPQPWSIT